MIDVQMRSDQVAPRVGPPPPKRPRQGIALRLFEAAPLGIIPPQVGDAIIWAGRAE
jgi:hypothetical protein